MGCKEDALKDLEIALQIDPDNEEFKEALSKCKESKQGAHRKIQSRELCLLDNFSSQNTKIEEDVPRYSQQMT